MSVLLATTCGDIVIDFDEVDENETNPTPDSLLLSKSLKYCIDACQANSLINIQAQIFNNQIIQFGDFNHDYNNNNNKLSINVESFNVFVVINDLILESSSSSLPTISLLISTSITDQMMSLPINTVKIGKVMEGQNICQRIYESINDSNNNNDNLLSSSSSSSNSPILTIIEIGILFDPFLPIPSISEFSEASRRAQVLELLGDLPSSEIKPSENVLFLCKLNPLTESDDLKIIFGRFGKIIDCKIIYDSETRKSLCYGFIEFENSLQCEAAYIKMNGAIIDDRKIIVDFSQSTAKEKFKQKKEKDKKFNENYKNNYNDKNSNYNNQRISEKKEKYSNHHHNNNNSVDDNDNDDNYHSANQANYDRDYRSSHRRHHRSRSSSPHRSTSDRDRDNRDYYKSHSRHRHRHRRSRSPNYQRSSHHRSRSRSPRRSNR